MPHKRAFFGLFLNQTSKTTVSRLANLPNTFIIGIQKAGTSSLYDWMAQHPDIYAPAAGKDFHFFSREDHYSKGLSHLAKRYDNFNGEQVVLNAGVNYIYFDYTAERIKRYYPKSKFILVLRDPVKRAFSAYNFMYKLGHESLPMDKALAREQQGQLRTYADHCNLAYIGHGYYYRQISQFLEHFPKEQLKIVLYEEMMKNKAGAMREIFDFLEIDSSFVPDFTTVNYTGEAKSKSLNRFLYQDSSLKQNLKRWFLLDRLLSENLRYRLRRYLREKNTRMTAKKELSHEEYLQMRALFEDDINHLSTLLGRDLNEIWK